MGFLDGALPVDLPEKSRKHKSALWVPGEVNQRGEALTILAVPSEDVASFADEARIVFSATYFYGVLERLQPGDEISVDQAFDVTTNLINPGATAKPFADALDCLFGYLVFPEE